MNRSQGAKAEPGFTLLEMLVTLAVLSAVSTMILGATLSLRRASAMSLAQESGEAEVIAAQSVLRSRIEALRAVPRAGRTSGEIDLDGDDQRLTFYAPPLDRDSPNSLQAFRLLRTATGDLILFSASALSENLDLHDPSLVGWNRTRLLGGTEELSISYFGPMPGSNGSHWQRFWSDRSQPPELIRIAVKLEGDSRNWPELIVRPKVTMNMACKFDALKARCSDTVS